MGAGTKFRETLGKINIHLTSLNDQPLSKAALVIIVFLDVFILVSVFSGLSQHTQQLSTPDEYIPDSCREIVINRSWNATNWMDNLSHITVSFRNRYYLSEEKKKAQHPVCRFYVDLVDQIKDDKALARVFEERSRVVREAGDLQQQIASLKGSYDTSLLETIAKQPGGQTRVDAIKSDFQQKTNALNTLRNRIAWLEQRIIGDAKVKQFWERLRNLQDQDREKLLSDLRRLNFWYPVKRLGMQLVFLLPLFAIFYVWNNASIKSNRGIQILVSSHLLSVSFIPLFSVIVETIYDIIPKILLKKIIELLEALRLIAIWHYLMIALGVAAALLLIYLVQKKLLSQEKLMQRRISKGACQQCGKHLPAASQSCPFCGFAQFRPCRSCGKPMHVHARYCRECGKPSAG